MDKRYIRLKEHLPLSERTYILTEEHHAQTDDSLPRAALRARIDEHGFIMNGNDIESDECIIWAGDSVIECFNIPETLRVCSVLEQKLNAAGYRIAIKNAGYSGSTLLHTINSVLNKIIPLRPKILIVSTGAIDQAACLLERNFWSTNIYMNPLTHAQANCPATHEPLIQFDPTKWHTLLEILLNICDVSNITLILTTIAYKSKHDEWSRRFMIEKDLKRSIEGYKRMNASIRSFCSQKKCACIDLERELVGRDYLFYDSVHLNVEGADIVSDIVKYRIVNFIQGQ